MMKLPLRLAAALPLLALLAGCDQLGIESTAQVQARQEAEGKAIGGACRHSGRPLEDCFEVNRRASKAAIYAGWRDMDAYMRENKIENAAAAPAEAEAPAKKAESGSDEGKVTPPAPAATAPEKTQESKPVAGKKTSALQGRHLAA